jgi:hypothetical protein
VKVAGKSIPVRDRPHSSLTPILDYHAISEEFDRYKEVKSDFPFMGSAQWGIGIFCDGVMHPTMAKIFKDNPTLDNKTPFNTMSEDEFMQLVDDKTMTSALAPFDGSSVQLEIYSYTPKHGMNLDITRPAVSCDRQRVTKPVQQRMHKTWYVFSTHLTPRTRTRTRTRARSHAHAHAHAHAAWVPSEPPPGPLHAGHLDVVGAGAWA